MKLVPSSISNLCYGLVDSFVHKSWGCPMMASLWEVVSDLLGVDIYPQADDYE